MPIFRFTHWKETKDCLAQQKSDLWRSVNLLQKDPRYKLLPWQPQSSISIKKSSAALCKLVQIQRETILVVVVERRPSLVCSSVRRLDGLNQSKPKGLCSLACLSLDLEYLKN